MRERILVIGDDSFSISTLVSAFRMNEMDVIGETKNQNVALNLARHLQPDVIVLDMQNAGNSAVKIANEIRKEILNVGIVILTSCSDLRFIGELNSSVPLGTKILVKKSLVDFSVLCSAVEACVKSAILKDPVMWIDGNISHQEKGIHSLMAQLTDTQAETLRLVADGMTNAQIGRTRFVSEKSVEQVLSRVAQELNVYADRNMNMRVQLVSEYYRWIGAPTH